MKQADLAIVQSNMLSLVATAVNQAHEALTSLFAFTELDSPNEVINVSNVTIDERAKRNHTVAKLVLAQALHPVAKMWLDEAKANVDREVDARDLLIPGGEMILHEDNVFTFTKRMNKNPTTCSTRDLCIELARLGVEKAIVDKAFANAEKVRKGNVYYEVKANED